MRRDGAKSGSAENVAKGLCAALIGSAVGAGGGAAQDAPLSWGRPAVVRPADASDVRRVITGQIDAFATGDEGAAYSATAPNVRRKFPTPGAFQAMARRDYAPLFEVERETFDTPKAAAATAILAETWGQSVEISTRQGEHWTATYGLERQSDGSIAITSCVLTRRADLSG